MLPPLAAPVAAAALSAGALGLSAASEAMAAPITSRVTAVCNVRATTTFPSIQFTDAFAEGLPKQVCGRGARAIYVCAQVLMFLRFLLHALTLVWFMPLDCGALLCARGKDVAGTWAYMLLPHAAYSRLVCCFLCAGGVGDDGRDITEPGAGEECNPAGT